MDAHREAKRPGHSPSHDSELTRRDAVGRLLRGAILLHPFGWHALSIDPLLARCIRCHLIRENAYEAGFSFFDVIELAPPSPTPDDNLL